MNKTKIKVEALVKFNNHHALVLNRQPKFIYSKYKNILWAKDEGFYSVYKKQNDPHVKAFAGREFILPLKDGLEERCSGQWWDAGIDILEEFLNKKISSVTYETKEELKKCYVFIGGYIDFDFHKELVNEYSGKIFGYWEYRKTLKGSVFDGFLEK